MISHQNIPRSIYQYSNTTPRPSGQNCKFAEVSFFSQFLKIETSMDTTKITSNIEVCSESLEAMLEI